MDSKFFNLYYINFSKVYEISMMIDNTVISSLTREKQQSTEKSKSTNSSIKAGYTINPLANMEASMSAASSTTQTNAYKLVETIDIKTTKSRLLNTIIDKCEYTENIENLNEGKLVKIDNVKLSILNEENLRQIIVLKGNALKGINVQGLELNNLVSSILQDYAYVLVGTLKNLKKIIIKIPLDIQNEFENKYSINDLLIGNVSIIGIYKEKVKEGSINLNTFNYLTEIGSKLQNNDEKFIRSSNPDCQENNNKNEEEYSYIDLIAIIQNVEFTKELSIEQKKLHWHQRLFKKILVWKKNE